MADVMDSFWIRKPFSPTAEYTEDQMLQDARDTGWDEEKYPDKAFVYHTALHNANVKVDHPAYAGFMRAMSSKKLASSTSIAQGAATWANKLNVKYLGDLASKEDVLSIFLLRESFKTLSQGHQGSSAAIVLQKAPSTIPRFATPQARSQPQLSATPPLRNTVSLAYIHELVGRMDPSPEARAHRQDPKNWPRDLQDAIPRAGPYLSGRKMRTPISRAARRSQDVVSSPTRSRRSRVTRSKATNDQALALVSHKSAVPTRVPVSTDGRQRSARPKRKALSGEELHAPANKKARFMMEKDVEDDVFVDSEESADNEDSEDDLEGDEVLENELEDAEGPEDMSEDQVEHGDQWPDDQGSEYDEADEADQANQADQAYDDDMDPFFGMEHGALSEDDGEDEDWFSC